MTNIKNSLFNTGKNLFFERGKRVKFAKKKDSIHDLVDYPCSVRDLTAVPDYIYENPSNLPFDHEKHGESLGLDCSKCHPGAESGIRAGMPSKMDRMDCHNLPLSDSPENEAFEKALSSNKAILEP